MMRGCCRRPETSRTGFGLIRSFAGRVRFSASCVNPSGPTVMGERRGPPRPSQSNGNSRSDRERPCTLSHIKKWERVFFKQYKECELFRGEGRDVGIYFYRDLEMHRLRKLANRVVAFLETQRAREFVIPRCDFVLEQHVPDCLEATLIHRKRLAEQLEVDRRRLREIERLARDEIVVELDRGWAIAGRERLAINMPSRGDVEVHQNAKPLAAETADIG